MLGSGWEIQLPKLGVWRMMLSSPGHEPRESSAWDCMYKYM